VCAEAQIARATFYRYFTDKQEVLDSVAGHYVREVAHRIAQAIEADPRPSARVEIVLSALTGFRHADADLGTMMQVAPGYTLDFLETTFPELIAMLTVALKPAFENDPPDSTVSMTPEQLAELVLRLLVSMLLLPGSDAAEIPSVITSLWSVVALS
jgi:AcrR family transcriptional regulator